MVINVVSGNFNDEELKLYEKYALEKEPNCKELDIELDGEYVNLTYHIARPFERIRRITGYLVGTLDRFNSAKKAEVDAREKHNL